MLLAAVVVETVAAVVDLAVESVDVMAVATEEETAVEKEEVAENVLVAEEEIAIMETVVVSEIFLAAVVKREVVVVADAKAEAIEDADLSFQRTTIKHKGPEKFSGPLCFQTLAIFLSIHYTFGRIMAPTLFCFALLVKNIIRVFYFICMHYPLIFFKI